MTTDIAATYAGNVLGRGSVTHNTQDQRRRSRPLHPLVMQSMESTMDNESKRKIMDSLTPGQRAGIAEIIRSADVEGDYTGMVSDGGSFWQEDASATLRALAWYFDSYDQESAIE